MDGIANDEAAVDDDVEDAFGVPVRMIVGCRVRDRGRIKDHQVGGQARFDYATIMQTQFPSRQSGHFVDGFLQFKDFQIGRHFTAQLRISQPFQRLGGAADVGPFRQQGCQAGAAGAVGIKID